MNTHAAHSLRSSTTEIDEAMVGKVVREFYARARRHQVLGPVLEVAIGDRWPTYLAKMQDYWTSVLLDTGRYHDNPILAHKQHTAIRPEHFDLWLGLWRETAHDTCPPRAAAEFVAKAEGIARSLKFNLYEQPEARANDDDHTPDTPDPAPLAATSDLRPQVDPGRTAPATEIHPRVFMYVFGAYVWMLFSLWMAVKSDGEAVFMVAISAFFLAMYAGIPITLSALGRKHINNGPPRRNDFAAFMDREISTYTGTLSGRDALLQITIIPILLAFGMTAIAFIIVHAQS